MPKKKERNIIDILHEYQKLTKTDKHPCEQLLGDKVKVNEFALIWERYQDDFKIIFNAVLLDFCKNGQFEKTDLNFYRQGLGVMNQFFEACHEEIKMYKEEKRVDNEVAK